MGMKKFFLLMFVMVEIVLVIQMFVAGLPSYMNDYIGLLFLLFFIFNLMLGAILLS